MPRRHYRTTCLFLLLLAVHAGALSQELAPPECSAPVRPADDQNDVQWHRFLAAIDQFRDCINTTAEGHQRAAEAHQEAARQAVERWNLFVRHSLNAPADFPWPPADAAAARTP